MRDVFRWYHPSAYGVPDILGTVPRDERFVESVRGVGFGIEVKIPGKKSNVSDNQRKFHERFVAAGNRVVIADSLEDINLFLFGRR